MSDIQVAAPAPVATATEGQATPDVQAEKADKTPAQTEFEELIVNGKTHKVTKEELKRRAQLGWAANEKFESASAKEKKVQKILEGAKANPIQALMDPELGLSRDQIKDAFEAWYHKEFIEPEGLTQEQLDARKDREELQKYKEQERLKKEQEEKETEEKMTAAEREQVQKSLIKAIDDNKLPKTKFTVSRMAFYMRKASENGVDIPMDLIAQQVRQEKQDIIGEMLHTQDIETAIQLVGEDFINKIRQYDLKRLREKRFGATPVQAQTPVNRDEKTNYDDVNKTLRLMRQGKIAF